MGEGLRRSSDSIPRADHNERGRTNDLNIVAESSRNSFHEPGNRYIAQLQTSGLLNLACPLAKRAKAFIYDQRGIVPARPGLLRGHNGSRHQPLSLAVLPSS